MQNALKNIIQKSVCCFRTFLLCHYQALGVYPENFSSCENVYVLELQNLSTSVGKEKMLESRTQPRALAGEAPGDIWIIRKGHCLLLWVGTWATTPNLTLCSRTEQLKPGQKKDLAHLRQLRGSLTFTQAEVRWEISTVRWGIGAESYPSPAMLVVMFGVHYLILTWPLLICFQIPCSRRLGFKT